MNSLSRKKLNKVYLLLGSNIDKEIHLPQAVRMIVESCKIISVSSVYETIPMGTGEQPIFFNAAAHILTKLDATELKEKVLNPIENKLYRKRGLTKNSPRTIDLDIILFNDRVFQYGHRHIPDPDLLKYPHVAVPISEIAPKLLHPETGEKISVIADKLLRKYAKDNSGFSPVIKRSDIKLL